MPEVVRIYACNLGAGGIDRRCAFHLTTMLALADNIEAGMDVSDYALDGDPDALCEGEDITSPCANLTADEVEAIERNLARLRVLVEQSTEEESHV